MIELTYELYLKAISHGVTPNPENVVSIEDKCKNVAICEDCPFDLASEYQCIVEIIDNPQSLIDSYYQRALKNNPEYLL